MIKRAFTRIISFGRNLLTSSLPIGGLEVSDASLKFLLVQNNNVKQASLRLPPGIIVGGRVKNPQQLLAALKNLHEQIAPIQKPVTAVLILPSQLVYAQSFAVPLVAREQLSESIVLNLQVLSPQHIDESYYDYQQIKENKDLGTIDLLGAFAKSEVVDEYISTIKAANFNIVAVEFPGLALTRLIAQRWGGLSQDQNYLAVSVNTQGILMLILKNGNLYFNHFSPWSDVFEAKGNQAQTKIAFADISAFLQNEIQRVLNFYLGRFGASLQEVILVSPIFNFEIVRMVSEHFKMKIRNLSIAELPKLQPNWFPVLGAALRGLISRSKDTAISLTKTRAQTEYYYERGLRFLALWRNIAISTLVFVLITFSLVSVAFSKMDDQLDARIQSEYSLEDAQAQIVAQKQVATFNELVTIIGAVVGEEFRWSTLLDAIWDLAGAQITITKIIAESENNRVEVSASTDSEQEAISFKNRLAADTRFINVDLPLKNIQSGLDGQVTFSLTFSLADLAKPALPDPDQN